MDQSYQPEDKDAMDEAIKGILSHGPQQAGPDPEPADAAEMNEAAKYICDQAFAQLKAQCQGNQMERLRQQAQAAHKRNEKLYRFIDSVSGGNVSVKMRASAFVINLIERFQEAADDETHCESPTMRRALTAYVVEMLLGPAEEFIDGVKNETDKHSVQALNFIQQISKVEPDPQ